MPIKAGNSSYAVIMSTTKTGAVGSETPTGDIVYFFAGMVKKKHKDNSKRKIIAGHAAYKTLMEKIDMGLIAMKCYVAPEVTATATQEMDAIEDFCYTYGSEIGADKVYIFLYNADDSLYKKLGIDSSGNQTNYLLGHPQPIEWVLQGNSYTIPSFVFAPSTHDGFLWRFCPSKILSCVKHCILAECSDTNVYDPALHVLRAVPHLFVHTIPEVSDRLYDAFCHKIFSVDTSG